MLLLNNRGSATYRTNLLAVTVPSIFYPFQTNVYEKQQTTPYRKENWV